MSGADSACNLLSWRLLFLQDPYMISGTIRSNIDVEGTHTDAEIWAVLELVALKDVVAEMKVLERTPCLRLGV